MTYILILIKIFLLTPSIITCMVEPETRETQQDIDATPEEGGTTERSSYLRRILDFLSKKGIRVLQGIERRRGSGDAEGSGSYGPSSVAEPLPSLLQVEEQVEEEIKDLDERIKAAEKACNSLSSLHDDGESAFGHALRQYDMRRCRSIKMIGIRKPQAIEL